MLLNDPKTLEALSEAAKGLRSIAARGEDVGKVLAAQRARLEQDLLAVEMLQSLDRMAFKLDVALAEPKAKKVAA